jgi:hypothetical protein
VTSVALGEPRRVRGDVVIGFRGAGRARFRVSHARDSQGEPDPFTWFDVSRVNDRSIAPEQAIRANVAELLVDSVEGDCEFGYRRIAHDWLRVLPLDEEDKEAVAACRAYAVYIESP